MKIAYLVNQYPKVSHSFIRREIAGVEACGLEVIRFSIRSCNDELVDQADKEEVEKTRFVLDAGISNLLSSLIIVALRYPKQWLSALKLALRIGRNSDRGILFHLIYLAEACVLLRWFSEEGVSHVHAHFGTNPTVVAMFCHALGGPTYSFTVHGPEEFDKPQSIALGEKINRAKFVVAVSSFGKSQLYRWCPYEQWKKINVVHCGIDSSFIEDPIPSILDQPALVCVGRLCEQKGQLLLIHAINQLAVEGFEFSLTLVGDGSFRSEVETLIKHYDLDQKVKITGWASGEEVRRYISESRALVLPSFAEGLPVVIMEALALGRPVISTYVAGIPELVEQNINGWLVPAGSVENLAESIRTALKTPKSQLEQMGRTGSIRVRNEYNALVESRKLSELFLCTSISKN